MSNKITLIDDFQEEIDELFDEITGTCKSALTVATKEMAKSAVKQLKKVSPSNTGKYAKGWSYTQSGDRYVVYNRTRASLTHLLNNDHKIIMKGKAYGIRKGDNHIGKVREAIDKSAEDFVQEELYKRL